MNNLPQGARDRIAQNARGLLAFATFFEFLGSIGLIATIALALAIASQEPATTDFFDAGADAGSNVPLAIFVGAWGGVSSLWTVAVARLMRLVTEYMAARVGVDLDRPSPGSKSAPTGDGWQ